MRILKYLVSKLFKQSDICLAGNLYMRRWRMGPEWLPGFRVHHIIRSDDDRALHDHPFDFVSIILKGGYWEYTADGSKKWYGRGSIIFRRAETLHRLQLRNLEPPSWRRFPGHPGIFNLTEQTAWTFVIRGPHRRDWGFQTLAGWVHNKLFITKREGHHYDTGAAK